MSAGAQSWRPLPLALPAALPVLLVSAEMGTASYTVRLTDMAAVWTETLDRKGICTRGWSENTSIDPSDTPENMARFLASLRSALDPWQPGHENTSLSLSGDADGGLTLRLTCHLPGFGPLKWPVHLKKSPPSSLATDLVIPLIQAHYTRQREVDSLIQLLGQKDSVINKLSHKLETTGTGLEHVFTALSGRKKVTRLTAEAKVKGLAPFNQHSWRAHSDHDLDGPGNTADLVQRVFGESGIQSQVTMQVDESPALDKWWRDLDATSPLVRLKPVVPVSQLATTPSPQPRPTDVSQDDDDFQVQATPPHLPSLAKAKAEMPAPAADNASTEGEDEGVATVPDNSPRSASTQSYQQTRTGRGPAMQLGAIGRSKQPAAPPSSTLEPPASAEEQSHDDEIETASEADHDAKSSVSGTSPRPPEKPAPARPVAKRALGEIGGALPRPETCAADKAELSGASGPSKSDPTPAPRRLGGIGKIDRGNPSDGVIQRGRQQDRQDQEVDDGRPRETSQERADRKRKELKKELEKKAAAGPAKKRRRF